MSLYQSEYNMTFDLEEIEPSLKVNYLQERTPTDVRLIVDSCNLKHHTTGQQGICSADSRNILTPYSTTTELDSWHYTFQIDLI